MPEKESVLLPARFVDYWTWWQLLWDDDDTSSKLCIGETEWMSRWSMTQFIADITKAQGFPKLHWRNLCEVRKMV
jgi:hypothetical protein